MPTTCEGFKRHDVADRYVLGQLTSEEAEAFEDHYMTCQTCVAEVERAELLVRGMKRVAAEEVASRDVEAPAGGAAVADLEAHRRRRAASARPLRQVGALLAAALAGAVLTLPLWIDRAGGGAADTAAVTLVHLQAERSVGEEPGHRVAAPGGGEVILALELTPPFFDAYRVRLERGGEVLWRGGDLELGERETVAVRLPSGLLEEGDHLLVLEGAGADKWVDAGRFTFRVAPSG